MRPSLHVHCYNGCIVGGVRFHTPERGFWYTIQNSGVMVIGKSNANGSDDNNFYDVLDEVLHVQYLMERSVRLFKCRWYNIDVNKSTMSSFSSRFDETDVMFLEFTKDLYNLAEGSSSVGDIQEMCAISTPGVGKLRSRQWEDYDVGSHWHKKAYLVICCLLQSGDRRVCKKDIPSSLP
ncbi:transposase family TNP2 [Cucumis melo var. makuwa]|uniref:Transposase family TNP2 n=1 Tax=Cucumis melo var. makuwa TaxID=1194695 RepID=A0A5A7TQH4_CUCMM|nr:transposase family TNP2 [Cucumis melo var. makuwa]TYK07513.1 transposase family TNP2 [Cucumis melo var. makuwa]